VTGGNLSKHNIYEVGGYVRDSIIGVENNDIDYLSEAESYESMKNYIAEKLKKDLPRKAH